MSDENPDLKDLKEKHFKLKEDFKEHLTSFKLQTQREKFWRYILLAVAGMSNGDIAVTVLKGILVP